MLTSRRLLSWISLASIRVLGLVGMFVVSWTLLRLGGAQDFGRYAYWIYWAMALAPLACGGTHLMLIRMVARYVARGREDSALGLISWCCKRALIYGFVIGLIFMMGLVLFGILSTEASLWWVLSLWGMVVLMLISGLWQGRGCVHAALAAMMSIRPVLVGLISAILLLFCAWESWSDIELLRLEAVVSLGAGLACVVLAWPHWRRCGHVDRRQAHLWQRAANGYMVIACLSGLTLFGQVLVAGTMLDDFEIGAFSTAVRIAGLVGFPLVIANGMIAHRISGLFAANDLRSLAVMLAKTSAASTMVAVGISAVLVVISSWVLAWFHSDYVSARLALVIMIGGQVFNVAAGPVIWYLNMTGRQKRVVSIQFQSLVLLVVMSYIAIPSLGITGAAVAAMLSMVYFNAAGWWSIRRMDGIDVSCFGFWSARVNSAGGSEET